MRPLGPSNSSGSLPVIEDDLSNGRCGYDYITLSFPVEQPNPAFFSQTSRRYRWSKRFRHSYHRDLLVRAAHVTLTAGRVAGDKTDYWSQIEFIPSKVVDPTSAHLCSFNEWPDVLDQVLEEALPYVTPKVDVEEFTVRRLDVSRDFDGVASFPLYAYSAFSLPMAHATRKEIFRKGGSPAQSVYAGTRTAGHVLLYDRHQKHPKVVPTGRVRFEVRGRNEGWLQTAGINQLGDLTHEAALGFLADRWAWFHGSTRLVGEDTFLQLAQGLVDDDGTTWSDLTVETFVGHAWMAARGVAKPLHSGRQAKYNKAIAHTGITLADIHAGTPLPANSTRYLDLYTGTEVRSQTEIRPGDRNNRVLVVSHAG